MLHGRILDLSNEQFMLRLKIMDNFVIIRIMKKILSLLFIYNFLITDACSSIEEHTGFIVTANEKNFSVISASKFSPKMEIVIENKTSVRLIGRIMLNRTSNVEFVSIEPQAYKKFEVNLKAQDILHYMPINPAFQEIELIVGNKKYEVPSK